MRFAVWASVIGFVACSTSADDAASVVDVAGETAMGGVDVAQADTTGDTGALDALEPVEDSDGAPDMVVVADEGTDAATTDAELPDAADPCGYGTIRGLACHPDQQAFLANVSATVVAQDCDGSTVTLVGVSDEDGFFIVEDVPQGLQTVTLDGGGLDYTVLANVVPDQITDVTPFGKKLCSSILAPDECYDGWADYKLLAAAYKLVDIIWAVDTSSSMWEEIQALQGNLNAFVDFIGTQNLDYHVVLIGDASVCIPPPLGGPACTDGEDYVHVVSSVGSKDALVQIVQQHPVYESFLRQYAQTHFIVVSDDNSSQPAAWFNDQVQPLFGFSELLPFVFHSIVGVGPLPTGCATAEVKGDVYIELSEETKGATFPICSEDWSSVYEAMGAAVSESVCSFAVTEATALKNAETIQLSHTDKLDETLVTVLPRVDGKDSCGEEHGFFVGPGQFTLCPASCDAFVDGTLELEWFCSTF